MQVVAEEYWLHMKIPLGNGTQAVLVALRNEPGPQTRQMSEVGEKVTHWLGLLDLMRQVWLDTEYQ